MSRKRAFDDSAIRFPVKREPLARADGVDTMYDAIYRVADGKQLSVVSRDYQLVEHAQAVDFVTSTLRERNVRVEPWRLALSNQGKRMTYEIKLPGYTFEVGDKDLHEPTIKIGNSIDKSKSFILDFGTYRQICTNGAHVGVRLMYVKESHYQNNIRFDPIGEELLNRVQDAIDVYKQRAEDLLKVEAEKFLMQAIETMPAMFMSWVAEDLQDNYVFDHEITGGITAPSGILEVRKQISAYALLQVMTAIATHRIQSQARRAALDVQIAKLIR